MQICPVGANELLKFVLVIEKSVEINRFQRFEAKIKQNKRFSFELMMQDPTKN